jgi:hypothetical protein
VLLAADCVYCSGADVRPPPPQSTLWSCWRMTLQAKTQQRRQVAAKPDSGDDAARCSATSMRPARSFCSQKGQPTSLLSPIMAHFLPTMLLVAAVLLQQGPAVTAVGSTETPAMMVETTPGSMGSGGGSLVAETPDDVQKSISTCAELVGAPDSTWMMRSSGRHGADMDICVSSKLLDRSCQVDRDWGVADYICSIEGGRLCTLDEITDGALQGAGCNLANKHVWTNTAVS